ERARRVCTSPGHVVSGTDWGRKCTCAAESVQGYLVPGEIALHEVHQTYGTDYLHRRTLCGGYPGRALRIRQPPDRAVEGRGPGQPRHHLSSASADPAQQSHFDVTNWDRRGRGD